jgi:hypothetical protein
MKPLSFASENTVSVSVVRVRVKRKDVDVIRERDSTDPTAARGGRAFFPGTAVPDVPELCFVPVVY